MDSIDNNLSTKSDMSAEELSGQLLKRSRENMKISQEEIADRLHLDIDVIRALENDNYDALPGKIYIKGYQRSYAALLGISAEDISSSDTEPVNSDQLLPESINYRNETKTKRFTYVWVSVVLLFVLIIFSEYIHMDSSTQELPEHKVSNKTETTGVTQQVNNAVKKDMQTSTKPEAGTTAPALQVRAGADKIKENKPVQFSGLVLKYDKSSWTEVYDAKGKKLVFGMIKRGEIIQVEGLQPFSVLLGNANEVKVEFAGKAFSTEKYIRNGMAQFVIGSPFNNKK